MSKKKEVSVKVRYPSARIKGIEGFIEFLQQPDWKPSKIDDELLKRMGVGKSKANLVVHTLQFLDVIDNDGVPTKIFDELKTSYSETLKRQIRKRYAGVLNVIPLSIANQAKLVSFFSTEGFALDTAEYQAKLFVWLCKQAQMDLPKVEGEFHRTRYDKKKPLTETTNE